MKHALGLLKATVATASLLALAACSGAVAGAGAPPLTDAPYAIRGEDAFRAGDRAALKAVIAELDPLVPASMKDPALLGCTAESYSLRRKARFLRMLQHLDNATVFANGEPGRFVFEKYNLYNGGFQDWPTDWECRNDPNYAATFEIETKETQAPRTAAQARNSIDD